MAVELQLRRDTAANIGTNAPLQGELWMDTTNNRLLLGTGLSSPSPSVVPVGIPSSPSGAVAQYVWIEQSVTLTASTTVTFTITLPTRYYAGSVFALASRIETTIGGSGVTGYEIGNSSSAADWGSVSGLTAGQAGGGNGTPRGLYSGGPTFNISPVGGTTFAAGGVIKIAALVLLVVPPTS